MGSLAALRLPRRLLLATTCSRWHARRILPCSIACSFPTSLTAWVASRAPRCTEPAAGGPRVRILLPPAGVVNEPCSCRRLRLVAKQRRAFPNEKQGPGNRPAGQNWQPYAPAGSDAEAVYKCSSSLRARSMPRLVGRCAPQSEAGTRTSGSVPVAKGRRKSGSHRTRRWELVEKARIVARVVDDVGAEGREFAVERHRRLRNEVSTPDHAEALVRISRGSGMRQERRALDAVPRRAPTCDPVGTAPLAAHDRM
jgi:hypothetical protein